MTRQDSSRLPFAFIYGVNWWIPWWKTLWSRHFFLSSTLFPLFLLLSFGNNYVFLSKILPKLVHQSRSTATFRISHSHILADMRINEKINTGSRRLLFYVVKMIAYNAAHEALVFDNFWKFSCPFSIQCCRDLEALWSSFQIFTKEAQGQWREPSQSLVFFKRVKVVELVSH